MKARFYRGPLDGKVKYLAEDMNTMIWETIKPGSLRSYHINNDFFPSAMIDTNRYIYNRTRHTHPDGSVFFEWEKPRGTKK